MAKYPYPVLPVPSDSGPRGPTLTSDNPTGGIGAILGTVLATAAAHRQPHES